MKAVRESISKSFFGTSINLSDLANTANNTADTSLSNNNVSATAAVEKAMSAA
ncbi:hypothetical protein R1T16_10080 [Flavobacterium sp. DG1-102-2]|uniref:hypothetical protein n=1 Tax=Flavobacterium sp. DG1-102-2 TaxID=3081663 RepID=UPI00294A1747|nr:hypothetical protein [Flavobacterium sp. DG1-102-2]MDV6168774.1 hypothetical protein [Flavobacterium sp. DG1-102-2]